MHSRLSILGDAKEKDRYSTRHKSERGPHSGAFDGPADPQIVTLGRKEVAQASGLHFGKTRRQQGREGTRKKIDGRTAVRYCQKRRHITMAHRYPPMSKSVHLDSNKIIEEQLGHHLSGLEVEFASDVLVFIAPIYYGIDDAIRDAVEAIADKKDKLTVLIETTGGFIEVAQRIADTFRKHYNAVEFVVPNCAMSAGTVLAMSGDAIHMDYYAVLGPIDPQVQHPETKRWVPANGYLVQYKRLVDKADKGKITTAELQFLIEKFDPAELYRFEQEMELSVALLKEWLVKYKFKDWNHTETRNKKVTIAMKKRAARAVADKLNDTDWWHSHSRGIPMEVLKRHVKLQIEDFGGNKKRSDCIRQYHKLLSDYMKKLNVDAVVHARGTYLPMR
jgi:hypothetical protein